MFTDIEGFTARTGRQTRAENERMLAQHDALLLPVVQGHGGRRIKTIGDAYLVLFRSSTAALRCGAAIQDRLALFNDKAADSEKLRVRVAVNAGEVRLVPGDVFGEPVNVCARLEGLTDAGEVRFTEAVWLSCERAAIEAEELGTHQLKGVEEPVKLFRLRRGTEPLAPYGGAALAALRLPPPDPETLVQAWVRGRKLRLFGAFGAAFAGLALSVGLAALVTGGGGAAGLVDDALGGKAEQVRARVQAAKPGALTEPERACVEGALLYAEGKFRRATRHLQECADGGERELAEQTVVRALTDEACEVRAAAAELAGEAKLAGLKSELTALAEAPPPAKPGGLRGLFGGGCDPSAAAKAALEALGR